MIGVQGEDLVHGARQGRGDFVFLRRNRKAHLQEVGRVIEIVLRSHKGLADVILVRPRRDGRHFRDHAMARDQAGLRIIDVRRVVIERGQRAHSADHDRHRVRVTTEAAEELVKLVVQHGVATDRPIELFEFLGVRQFTVLQQVGDFDEAGVVGQLIDRIAAIQKRAFIAVDIGDLAFA